MNAAVSFFGNPPLAPSQPLPRPFDGICNVFCTLAIFKKRAIFEALRGTRKTPYAKAKATPHAMRFNLLRQRCLVASPDLKAYACQQGAGRRGERPYVAPMFAYVGFMLPQVGPMLALCWPQVSLRWPYLGLMLAFVGPIFALCLAQAKNTVNYRDCVGHLGGNWEGGRARGGRRLGATEGLRQGHVAWRPDLKQASACGRGPGSDPLPRGGVRKSMPKKGFQHFQVCSIFSTLECDPAQLERP